MVSQNIMLAPRSAIAAHWATESVNGEKNQLASSIFCNRMTTFRFGPGGGGGGGGGGGSSACLINDWQIAHRL